MTSVSFTDNNGFAGNIEEMFKIPGKEQSNPASFIHKKESAILKQIEKNGGTVNSMLTTIISKRRYKRRLAKHNKAVYKSNLRAGH